MMGTEVRAGQDELIWSQGSRVVIGSQFREKLTLTRISTRTKAKASKQRAPLRLSTKTKKWSWGSEGHRDGHGS